jgi:predicted TIM-barrel fold metal-dependent hydrolase
MSTLKKRKNVASFRDNVCVSSRDKGFDFGTAQSILRAFFDNRVGSTTPTHFGMRVSALSSTRPLRPRTSPTPTRSRARAASHSHASASSPERPGRERVVASAAETTGSTRAMKLDAHLHVWPSPSEYAYAPGKEPPAGLAERSTAEALLQQCERAGVHGALIVQPINLMYDHAYVAEALSAHPGRFVGCCLADPSVGGAAALGDLLPPRGPFRAVRFNPGLWPEGERMTNEAGKAMFKLAGERGAFVGFMCFHGLHLHVEQIKDLCAEFPATRVLMDHFGFVKGTNDPNWQALLSLAEFPQVYVKASAQFRVAPKGEQWPYETTGPALRGLLDAFGRDRVVWGSDFPYVEEQCGYERATKIAESCGAQLSAEEVEAVMGGNLARMFPGGWTS